MPCYCPLDAWKLRTKTEKGKSEIVFSRRDTWANGRFYDLAEPLNLPCGQCIGCRLERSRQWAVRLMHESQMHDRSSFLTLTYNDEHLPPDGSLSVRPLQLFMKKLRKLRGYAKLRYFACGEYGEKSGRAHYHMILFGEDFYEDRVEESQSQSGFPQWSSPTLTRLWSDENGSIGNAFFGAVSFESAAYVARYALKKVTGKDAELHYDGRKPEFVVMSRRPGIGSSWIDRFGLDNVYNYDRVIMRGRSMLPPKFYDKLLEKVAPDLYRKIQRERQPDVEFYANPDTSTSRLHTRMTVKEFTVKHTLKRGVE